MSHVIELREDKEECIHGVIYNMSPAAHHRHGEIIDNIVAKLNSYLDKSICRAYGDKIDVYFNAEGKNYVMPDVSIICDRSKFKGGKYFGIPKFVVEVLSPRTRIKDLTEKKSLYEEQGVEEYWIIEHISKSVDIYYLIDKKYSLVNSYTLIEDEELEDYNVGTIITLKSFPNVEIKIEEIFE